MSVVLGSRQCILREVCSPCEDGGGEFEGGWGGGGGGGGGECEGGGGSMRGVRVEGRV